jgi:hypothetical protein
LSVAAFAQSLQHSRCTVINARLQVIRFSVWDKDPTESEMIGQVVEKFNKLDRLPGCATDVQWYNMYGAPEFKNEKLLSNLKKGAMAVAKAAQQTFAGEVDWAVRLSIFFLSCGW